MTTDNDHQQQLEVSELEQGAAESATEHCSNCGQVLRGEYCSACGQSRRHFLRFFPAVVGDFIAETFEIDGRLSRTLRTLLLHPGRLTNEYIAGRRVHYSPPVRFYLFTSLLAFLLISYEINQSVAFDQELAAGFQDGSSEDSGATKADTDNTADRTDQADSIGANVTDEPETDDDSIFVINGSPWDARDNPMQIGFLPPGVNQLLNERLARIQDNAPRIRQNPGLLVDQFLRYLPQTLLVLLPLFALMLKLFYPFSKRFYTEHVIFSIHMHSFTLLLVIIIVLLGEAEQLSTWGWLDSGLNGAAVIAALWLPVYGMLAQKRVYRQGWMVTVIKYLLLYGLYFCVQMLAMVVIILLGASSL